MCGDMIPWFDEVLKRTFVVGAERTKYPAHTIR
jgi:hypothetical protein